MATAAAPSVSEAAGRVSKLDAVLYHFFTKTLAVATECRLTDAPPRTGGRTNKWVCIAGGSARLTQQFSLELEEVDRLRESLRPWRSVSAPATRPVPPLVVDVFLSAAALAPGHVLVPGGAEGAAHRERGAPARVHLERWSLALDAGEPAGDVRLPAVYKRAIVHFRTLYALARLLPTQALVHRVRAAKERRGAHRRRGSLATDDHDAELEIELAVQGADEAGAAPDASQMRVHDLAPVQTPIGMLLGRVHYREHAEFRVLPQEQAASAGSRAEAPGPSLAPPHSLTPIAIAAQRSKLPEARAAHARNTSGSTGPGMSLSPSRASAGRGVEPAFVTGRRARTSGTPRSIESSAISQSPLVQQMLLGERRGALPSTPGTEPPARSLGPRAEPASLPRTHRPVTGSMPESGLRSLFQTYAATGRAPSGASPSSLSSLRSLREASPETGTGDPATAPARPQTIQRYQRQLPYRQRDAARLAGSQDDGEAFGASPSHSNSARSWTQRIEQRRAMERHMRDGGAGGGGRSLGSSTSPSFSRLFRSPAAPALVVPRAAAAEQRDDLDELVRMIDTRRGLGASPDTGRASLQRSPSPAMPATPHSAGWDAGTEAAHQTQQLRMRESPLIDRAHLDDLLTRMADSLQLKGATRGPLAGSTEENALEAHDTTSIMSDERPAEGQEAPAAAYSVDDEAAGRMELSLGSEPTGAVARGAASDDAVGGVSRAMTKALPAHRAWHAPQRAGLQAPSPEQTDSS